MSITKNSLFVCLVFASVAFASCNSTANSSSASDTATMQDTSSSMQMSPDASAMSDTAITDTAAPRPVKNPPKP